MQTSSYSSNTLVYNWFEDVRALETRLKDFQRKQKNSDLKVSHTRKTFYNLFKELPFIQKGRYVKFGQTVQIVTPFTPGPNGKLGLTLCGTVTEKDIDEYGHFSDQSLVNVSPVSRPYMKNLFKILPCKGSQQKEGDDIRYGDEFLIATTGSWSGKPLYVRSDPPSAMSPGNDLNHGVVTFTSKEDSYCQWKSLYENRDEREAMETHPIEPSTRMMIKQVMTNKSLSAEPTLWYQTFFGPEADVSVHDYQTPKRTDSVNSIWMFVTQEKRDSDRNPINDGCETINE
ncbi:hypothetical protein GE061_011772 [Apolygus lucorum]|uniref:Uncharacterized protein n=1 Tax=Apolygus lucorum TaxID=248454 RepID=A0A8S9XY87_APOLU|nr:hypothetical protein GE061_011772 [Apolygus lucorum]